MDCSYLTRAILLVLFSSVTECCNTFKTVTATILPKKGDAFVANITGCIERTTFSHLNVIVVHVDIVNQSVPHLNVGSVQNMASLTYVTFKNCSTQTIKPHAFRNAPRLKGIIIEEGFLKTIPKGVFQGLPILHTIRLPKNQINNIEDGAFADIPTLTSIMMWNNKLEEWKANWFTNSVNLETLDFRHNLIREIPSNAFPNLQHLTTMWFDYNEITHIELDAFRGLKHLINLGLSFNCLTVVKYEAFPNNFHVDNLLLSGNKLNFLETEVLDKLAVKEIHLGGNPWQCGCLDTIGNWLNTHDGKIIVSKSCTHANIPVCIVNEVELCAKVACENVTLAYANAVKSAIARFGKEKMKDCYRLD